jgi:hypothetical protein
MMNVSNQINSTNSLNFINSFNAKNAFAPKTENTNISKEEKEDLAVSHVSNSILNRINVEEVQQYAQNLGENVLSEDELKYGLIFGRSVLVDVQA